MITVLTQLKSGPLQAYQCAGHGVSDVYLPLRPSPDERPRILRQTHGNAKETNHHNVKTFLVIQGFFFDSITEFFQPESNGAPIRSSTACATL